MSDIRNWINGTCKSHEFCGSKAWVCKKHAVSCRQTVLPDVTSKRDGFFIDYKLHLVGHCIKQHAECVFTYKMGLDNISMMWIRFGFVESSNSLWTKRREKERETEGKKACKIINRRRNMTWHTKSHSRHHPQCVANVQNVYFNIKLKQN